MAKTDAASTKDFVDHSYFYKPYSIAAAIGFILWAAYVCWTGYWGIMKGRLPVIDIGMQLAILWWLLDTVRTKTVYRLEKDRLYMLKTGLWRKNMIAFIKGTVDSLSLLYDIGSTQKVGRVLMKASEDFWKEFEKRMPGQIRIPQEEVVALTYKSIEKKLREQGYFKDHPEMDFEEGIKQLRQKGTEMGGRDDELTGEDFHGEKVEMKNGTRTDTIEAAKRRMEKK